MAWISPNAAPNTALASCLLTHPGVELKFQITHSRSLARSQANKRQRVDRDRDQLLSPTRWRNSAAAAARSLELRSPAGGKAEITRRARLQRWRFFNHQLHRANFKSHSFDTLNLTGACLVKHGSSDGAVLFLHPPIWKTWIFSRSPTRGIIFPEQRSICERLLYWPGAALSCAPAGIYEILFFS